MIVPESAHSDLPKIRFLGAETLNPETPKS